MPLKEILDRAFAERYGVAAFNVVNDLTLEAVIAAAEEVRSPLIVQTSVKTVKSMGAEVLYGLFRAMAEPRGRPGHAAPRPLPGARGGDHLPRGRAGTPCCSTGRP